jgi:serine/threonine protein kinase
MINFDDLQIIKKLGSGSFGSSYLVKTIKNNNKEYVLKIQKILYSDKKLKDNIRDYKEQIWREIDLHEFINTIDKKDQVFFTKLFEYKIDDNCDIQTSELYKDIPYFKKLYESKWCIKFLLEYKDGITLKDFLLKNTLNEKQIYSILLQLCKIILILYNGGYSHGDLHLENIIINKTNNKFFDFMDKKIPFNGYQINVIDYGFSLHKKYGKFYKKTMKRNGNNIIKYMFNEMFFATYKIINNYVKYINDCTKAKKKLPWERKDYKLLSLIYKIINKHSDFYKTTKDKYLKIYPYVNKFFKHFENDKEMYELYNKKHYMDFLHVVNRIEYEFHLLYPKLYAKYGKWCSYYEHLLPNDVVLKLLSINNHTDYVNYLISKCLQF